MLSDEVTIFLIAPNVSEQMGGEAMKALQIFQELTKIHSNTIQITHERNKSEILDRLKLKNVLFVKDDWISVFLWKSVIFRLFVNVWFSKKAIILAEKFANQKGLNLRKIILHQTEPNSPVAPRTISPYFLNIFGPINGNIYYPKIFRKYETFGKLCRRIFHFPAQKLNSFIFQWAAKADLLLIAGGKRTEDSMLAAGVKPEQMVDSLDCGIKDEILNFPRIEHNGKNLKFVFFGRLVFHKCIFLVIESLAKTKNKIVLDIIGKGPELETCRKLARKLGIEDRVNFLDWYEKHSDLLDSLKEYRGFTFPSIEDANGIAVQEAMALGLPTICLDWGGPQLLVDHGITGYLIEPKSKEFIIDMMASYLDELAINGELAEKMSLAARQKAESWHWSQIMNKWTDYYTKILEQSSSSK